MGDNLKFAAPTQLSFPGINWADVDQLLSELRQAGVELAVVGDRLRFRPRSAVTGGLLEHIKLCKSDVIARMHAGSGQTLPGPRAAGCLFDDPAISRDKPHPVVAACICYPPAHRNLVGDCKRLSDSSDSGDSSMANATRVSADASRVRAECHTDGHAASDPSRVWAESLESPELSRLIAWSQANRDRLQQEPFLPRSGCRVVRPHRLYHALDWDVAARLAGTRARYGLPNELTDSRNLAAKAGLYCRRAAWSATVFRRRMEAAADEFVGRISRDLPIVTSGRTLRPGTSPRQQSFAEQAEVATRRTTPL
jgi:hypothetical protein